jgi:hypothetical protein
MQPERRTVFEVMGSANNKRRCLLHHFKTKCAKSREFEGIALILIWIRIFANRPFGWRL